MRDYNSQESQSILIYQRKIYMMMISTVMASAWIAVAYVVDVCARGYLASVVALWSIRIKSCLRVTRGSTKSSGDTVGQ